MTFPHWHGRARVVAAGLLIGVIALIDWRVELNLSFGFLYLFPIILVGTVLSRWQIGLAEVAQYGYGCSIAILGVCPRCRRRKPSGSSRQPVSVR